MARNSNNQPVLFSSESDEWATPRKIIRLAREVMGSIDTDPCSCKLANDNIVKAATYYDINQNGLTKVWKGNVWLNPAFTIKFEFAQLADYYYRTSIINQCCFLSTLNSVATKSMICFDKYPVCIVRGRINFLPMDNQPESSNTVHTTIFYLGENIELFDYKFAPLGDIRYPSPRKIYYRKKTPLIMTP